MKVLKRHIFLAGMLVSAISMAATSTPAKSAKSSKTVAKTAKTAKIYESTAKLEKQLEIYEHAAANRELAALTQMEQAKNKEEEATEATTTANAEDLTTYKSKHSSAGALENAAALLYGKASANFDKAALNRTKVATICKKLDKVQQQQSSQIYSTNMKSQGNEAIQMAADAYEAAAVAYDKAEDLTAVALSSQLAATWLEKLALRQ